MNDWKIQYVDGLMIFQVRSYVVLKISWSKINGYGQAHFPRGPFFHPRRQNCFFLPFSLLFDY